MAVYVKPNEDTGRPTVQLLHPILQSSNLNIKFNKIKHKEFVQVINVLMLVKYRFTSLPFISTTMKIEVHFPSKLCQLLIIF